MQEFKRSEKGLRANAKAGGDGVERGGELLRELGTGAYRAEYRNAEKAWRAFWYRIRRID